MKEMLQMPSLLTAGQQFFQPKRFSDCFTALGGFQHSEMAVIVDFCFDNYCFGQQFSLGGVGVAMLILVDHPQKCCLWDVFECEVLFSRKNNSQILPVQHTMMCLLLYFKTQIKHKRRVERETFKKECLLWAELVSLHTTCILC